MRIRGFASAWRAVNRAISERLPLQAATCFRAPVDLRSFSSAAGHGIRSERIAAPLHGPRTCHSAAVHARTFSLAAYPIREERLAAPLHRLLGEPFPRRFPASTRSFSSGREEEIHRLLAQPFSPRVTAAAVPRLLQPIPPSSRAAHLYAGSVEEGEKMIVRRFVNIVAESCTTAVCSVHRLDVSEHLFFPSAAEAEAAPKPKPEEVSRLAALPTPTVSFQAAPRLKRKHHLVALVSPRSSESRILWSCPAENALICDADSGSIYALPSLRYKGLDPITISIARPDAPQGEEDLYVMSTDLTTSTCCFQVLRFGCHYSDWAAELFLKRPEFWQWESLPPPPLPRDLDLISSHAVLDDGRTICVTGASSCGYGDDTTSTFLDDEDDDATSTCLFDTVERKWRHAPRGWDLPAFSGGAEYVPDLKLWLGLSTDENHKHNLCAWDLAAAAPPTLKHRWEDLQTPKERLPEMARLLNLGDGRFCIARVIQEVPDMEAFDKFGVCGELCVQLTGVEMVVGGGDSEEQGRLRMVMHKSVRYFLTADERVSWIL